MVAKWGTNYATVEIWQILNDHLHPMKLVGKILGAMAVCSGLGVLDIPAQENAAEEQAATLRIQGSDTMLQVNLKFAEQYAKEHPMKRVTVRGEGSSTGFRAQL